MKIFKIQMLSSFLVLMPFCISGQQCYESLRKSCALPDEKEFTQFNISRTALVEVNKANLCSVVFPPNKEYIIRFCCESKYKPLKIKLIDKNNNKIIFDNSTDEFKESASFSVADNPVNILIEITVASNKSNFDDSELKRACAGFWIFLRKRIE